MPSSITVKSASELTASLKRTKGLVNYAFTGNGTPALSRSKLFNKPAGAAATHIRYKGPTPQRLGDSKQPDAVKWKKVIDDVGIKLN